MKKGLLIFAIGMLIAIYMGSTKNYMSTEDADIQKISEIEPVPQNPKNLRDAFTKSWKGSKIDIARQNLEESPGQIITGKPKVTAAEKKEAARKKKKRIAKKGKLKRFQIQTVNHSDKPKRNPPLTPQEVYSNGGGVYVPPAEAKTDTPQTVDGWMERLINPINKQNLDNLILSFQSGLISSELFYAVIDELLENDGTEVQQLGIIALASTPSSQSFERTVKYIEEQADSTNGADAREAILAYKKLEAIQILNQQLYSKDSSIQFQAAVLIRDSALDLLRLRPETNVPAPSPSPIPPTVPAGRTISSRDLQIYAQSFTSIQSLLAAGQTQHQGIFQETLQVLERLLRT